jgi:hypothetical protein
MAGARQACIDNGGSISHHHGIGTLRAAFESEGADEATVAYERDVRRAMVSGGMVAIGSIVLLVTRTYHHFSFVFPGGDTWFWEDRNGSYLWGPVRDCCFVFHDRI